MKFTEGSDVKNPAGAGLRKQASTGSMFYFINFIFYKNYNFIVIIMKHLITSVSNMFNDDVWPFTLLGG